MKLKSVNALKSGWTRWQNPIMKGYLMGCCDCGLVHEMEFKIVKLKGKPKKNGWWKNEEMNPEKYRIAMRAKRVDK